MSSNRLWMLYNEAIQYHTENRNIFSHELEFTNILNVVHIIPYLFRYVLKVTFFDQLKDRMLMIVLEVKGEEKLSNLSFISRSCSKGISFLLKQKGFLTATPDEQTNRKGIHFLYRMSNTSDCSWRQLFLCQFIFVPEPFESVL